MFTALARSYFNVSLLNGGRRKYRAIFRNSNGETNYLDLRGLRVREIAVFDLVRRIPGRHILVKVIGLFREIEGLIYIVT